jgi:hypothetical protein
MGPRDAAKLGYDVGPAMFDDTDEHATVYRVVGFGLNVQVAEDDAAAWKGIAEKKVHAERKKQHAASQRPPKKKR